MAESDNDSEFASAESDQEEQGAVTVNDPSEKTGGSEQSETSKDEPQDSNVEVDTTKVDTGEETQPPPSPDQSTEQQNDSIDTSQTQRQEDVGSPTQEVDTSSASDQKQTLTEGTPPPPPSEEATEGPSSTTVEPAPKEEGRSEEKQEGEGEKEPQAGEQSKKTQEEASASGGWGWGSWGGIWTSVSTVTESAQAIGKKVSSVIASVEDTLGLPSPEELAQGGEGEGEIDEETKRLAEEMVEHDVPPEDLEPIVEEPHHQEPIPIPVPQAEQDSDTEQQGEPESDQTLSSVTGFFSGFASVGKELMSGGLDALEVLGKKTMEVLTEGDPGLRDKRGMLGGGGGSTPTLSQLLQEAKADSEAVVQDGSGAATQQLPLTYSRLFDEYQGVAHLEALDLLSKECLSKVRIGLADITGEELQTLKKKMEEVVQAFVVEEEPDILDDDNSQLHEVLELFSDITLPLKVDKLMRVSTSWREKVKQTSSSCEESEGPSQSVQGEEGESEATGGGEREASGEPVEEVKEEDSEEKKRGVSQALYENGLRSLAELTSASIELFRKMAEVSLLPDAQKTSNPLEQAQKFNRLTVLVSTELDSLASVHAEAITELDLKDTNSSVTSLYLESSNSGSYVQDAFQLLIPVLKYTLVQQSLSEEPPTNVMSRN